MSTQGQIQAGRLRRRHRVRNRVRGTSERPRLSVFRSSKHIYAQVIDDVTGKTLASASSRPKGAAGKGGKGDKGKKSGAANAALGANIKAASDVGTKLAEAAKQAGVTKVCFDRGHYKYHGRVKALADAVRAGGIQF